jgi:hypothetical protein
MTFGCWTKDPFSTSGRESVIEAMMGKSCVTCADVPTFYVRRPEFRCASAEDCSQQTPDREIQDTGR